MRRSEQDLIILNQTYVVDSTVIRGRMYSLKEQLPCCTNQCAVQSVYVSYRTAVSHVGMSACELGNDTLLLSTALLEHHVCFWITMCLCSSWRRDDGLTFARLLVHPHSHCLLLSLSGSTSAYLTPRSGIIMHKVVTQNDACKCITCCVHWKVTLQCLKSSPYCMLHRPTGS